MKEAIPKLLAHLDDVLENLTPARREHFPTGTFEGM
jgi:hypothetical protein